MRKMYIKSLLEKAKLLNKRSEQLCKYNLLTLLVWPHKVSNATFFITHFL